MFRQFDFKVLRSSAWSDEANINVLVFELESSTLNFARKHYGPPVASPEDDKLLLKHICSEQTFSGPFIEGGKWAVLVKRKFPFADALLKAKLKDSGQSIGVASHISAAIKQRFRILQDSEILDLYREHRKFRIFLTKFLKGTLDWLYNDLVS